MLLLLLFIMVLLLAFYWSARNEDFNKIPGPPGILFFNNSLDFLMDSAQLFLYFRQLCYKYKMLYKLKVGNKKGVILHSPVDIEKVISSTKHNTKGFLYNFIRPWLADGLLLSKGEKWYQRRKLLTPAFHFNVLTNFKTLFEGNYSKLVESLKVETNKSETNIAPYINAYTLNTICETVLRIKLDEDTSSSAKAYRQAVQVLGKYAVYRAQRVWMYPNYIFNLTPLAKKQGQRIHDSLSFRDQVIEKRRKLYNENDKNLDNYLDAKEINRNYNNKLALLDLLLEAENDGVIDAKGIGEEVDTVMLAGHETSATALQLIIMLLANHQDKQEKVVEECNEVFGSSDRSVTMSNLSQLKYLECCIKESLRLYPPVPMITRKIEHPLKLDNYDIPIGTECVILIFDLHRRSDQFVDPLEFRPERFLTRPTWHPYAYIPFSAGPRNCLGQKFAMMQLKLTLSALLRRYRFLPVTTPQDIVFLMDYTMCIKDPIYVRIEERNK